MPNMTRAARGRTRAAGRRSAPPRLRPSELRFHPLTPARWADVEELFGPRGACAGCWCMWPRLTAAEFSRRNGAENRREFRRVVRAGVPPGILAYRDGAPIGWCAVAPRAAYRRLERSRVLQPVDDRPVWSVVCFFISRPYRRRGLAARLLRAAVEFAAARGARIVEGYPVEPASGGTADAFAWPGLPSAFRRVGFVEVARRSPTRPVMRRVLRAPRGAARAGSGARRASAAPPSRPGRAGRRGA